MQMADFGFVKKVLPGQRTSTLCGTPEYLVRVSCVLACTHRPVLRSAQLELECRPVSLLGCALTHAHTHTCAANMQAPELIVGEGHWQAADW
jgi:hypothetical protein